jgi:cytochrome c oxidase assembly protein subunit 15
MVHRYLAMIVGALIAAIMVGAWPVAVVVAAVAERDCCGDIPGGTGCWTVTMLLKPAIVTSHLLGGITILGLLVWLLYRQASTRPWATGIMPSGSLRLWGGIALATLFSQIVLGGWVSTNYAALACTDFPTCHGVWMPAMDFANAFHVIRPLGVGPNGELLTIEALRAIRSHRVGAIVALA